MGDSSTSAREGASAPALRMAMAAPIERPNSTGQNGSSGSIVVGRLGEEVKPGVDITRFAAAKRRKRSVALAVTA